MEAAFCKAVRTTLAGSTTPCAIKVAVLAGRRVVAMPAAERLHLVDDNAAFLTRVFRDLAQRLFNGAAHDVHADLLVAVQLQAVQRGLRVDQRHAAARHNAFFDGRAGRVHGVLDARLLFFQFGFGRRADLHDGHAAGQFRQPLLQFLLVVVAFGVFDLALDLVDAALNGVGVCPRRRRSWSRLW